MNRYTGASLAVLKEASDTQEKSKASSYTDSEDTLTASTSGSQNGCDDQSSFNEQFLAQPSCGDRITIEITDPRGRCVELVKQLEAVKRAIVAPLEREIARIKNSPAEELGSPEIQELETILMPTLSLLSDQGHETLEEEKNNFVRDESEVLPDPLVDQSLRRHTEKELLAMRESLEFRKDWRAFYAYHLERFRQLHAAVVLQYHDKLTEVDQRCRNTEEDLRVANRDLAQISQVTIDKTKEVVRLERENKRALRELETFKHESAKRLLKIAKEHRSTKSKLESELKVATEEIDALEDDIKKYEGLKKESRSSKRLNAVLNDKLRVKTKEATDLFAENLKLREQGMLLRRDLTNASQQMASLSHSLATVQEEKAALVDELQTAKTRSSLEQEDVLQANHQLELRVEELETLLETQHDELKQRCSELEQLRNEMSQLRAGKDFEREVNEGLCETLEGALREAYEQRSIQYELLLDARLSHELTKQELSLLTAEFDAERECANNLITSLQEQLDEADVVREMQERDVDESQRILFAFSDEAAALKSDLEFEGRLGHELQVSLALRLQEAVAHNEVKDAQIMESRSRNDFLEAETARQHAEIEALREQAVQFSKELDSQRERSSVLANKHTDELNKLQEANASLLGQLTAIKSASDVEREASVEEIESLKIDIGGLQMDNQLLEYEISQLKAHLEIVMEENVLLSDNAFEAGEFGAREQSDIDFGMIIASFDLDDEMAIASSCAPDAAPLSHMMQFSSLSQGAIDENMLAAFGELDQALRSNEALLNQVSKAGLTPKWEPRVSCISIAVDDHDARRYKESSVSKEAPATTTLLSTRSVEYREELAVSDTNDRVPGPGPNLVCAPVAPVSQIIDSATLADVRASPVSTVEVDLGQLAGVNSPKLSLNMPATLSVTSVPSDEYRFVRNARPDSVDGLQPSSVTKSSLLLADHLIDVLEGKEGSDDAVLEEMDNLRTLLFDLERKEPLLDLPTDSSGTDESTLAGGVEVTLDDFIARDHLDQQALAINDMELPLAEDEWFDRMMHDALDFDSDLKADDASREECPDLADPRQGEDRIRIDLGEISFEAAASVHQCEGQSSERAETQAIVVTENKKVLDVSILPCFNIPDDWNTAGITADNTPESLVSMPKGCRDYADVGTKLSVDIDQETFALCQWQTPCANDSGETQPHQLCGEMGLVDHSD